MKGQPDHPNPHEAERQLGNSLTNWGQGIGVDEGPKRAESYQSYARGTRLLPEAQASDYKANNAHNDSTPNHKIPATNLINEVKREDESGKENQLNYEFPEEWIREVCELEEVSGESKN